MCDLVIPIKPPRLARFSEKIPTRTNTAGHLNQNSPRGGTIHQNGASLRSAPFWMNGPAPRTILHSYCTVRPGYDHFEPDETAREQSIWASPGFLSKTYPPYFFGGRGNSRLNPSCLNPYIQSDSVPYSYCKVYSTSTVLYVTCFCSRSKSCTRTVLYCTSNIHPAC